MRSPRARAAWTALAVVLPGLVALTACSGGGADPATSTSSAAVGGTAVCDEPTLTAAVSDDVAATYPGATFKSLEDFTCDQGWAIARARVETSGAAVRSMFLLRAEGANWIPVALEDVCGTPGTAPQAIEREACGTPSDGGTPS